MCCFFFKYGRERKEKRRSSKPQPILLPLWSAPLVCPSSIREGDDENGNSFDVFFWESEVETLNGREAEGKEYTMNTWATLRTEESLQQQKG